MAVKAGKLLARRLFSASQQLMDYNLVCNIMHNHMVSLCMYVYVGMYVYMCM